MPYLNIDDGMDEHPKIEALSDEPANLQTLCGSCNSRKGART